MLLIGALNKCLLWESVDLKIAQKTWNGSKVQKQEVSWTGVMHHQKMDVQCLLA